MMESDDFFTRNIKNPSDPSPLGSSGDVTKTQRLKIVSDSHFSDPSFLANYLLKKQFLVLFSETNPNDTQLFEILT